MSEYRVNHYIPQFILNNFRSAAGEFFYLDKARGEKVSRRNVSKVFAGSRIFWGFDDDGNPEKSLETEFYRDLDFRASILVSMIVGKARNSERIRLSIAEKELWDNFVFLQMKRLPKTHEKIEQHVKDGVFNSILSGMKDHGLIITEEMIAKLRGELESKENLQNARLFALRDGGELTPRLLSGMGLLVARVSRANKSFIIGDWPFVSIDRPVVARASGAPGEIWFPIAKDVAVSHYGAPGIVPVVNLTDRQLRSINEEIFRQSSKVGGPAAELLESLVANVCGRAVGVTI